MNTLYEIKRVDDHYEINGTYAGFHANDEASEPSGVYHCTREDGYTAYKFVTDAGEELVCGDNEPGGYVFFGEEEVSWTMEEIKKECQTRAVEKALEKEKEMSTSVVPNEIDMVMDDHEGILQYHYELRYVDLSREIGRQKRKMHNHFSIATTEEAYKSQKEAYEGHLKLMILEK